MPKAAKQKAEDVEHPSNDDTIPHTVTSEDMENNPELAEAGIKEGDEIGLPVASQEEPTTEAQEEGEPTNVTSTAPSAIAQVISTSGQVVRTYTAELNGENFRELASEFAAKHGLTVK